jgi:hypothetical protein
VFLSFAREKLGGFVFIEGEAAFFWARCAVRPQAGG